MAEKPDTEKPDTEKTKNGKPAHVLLAAISRAVGLGVDKAKICAAVDLARKATSTEQAPVWRMCARMLDEYSEQIKPEL